MIDKTSIIGENEYIVVDIETTGFSVGYCHIIEIAALKVRHGEIINVFQTFVQQNDPIPSFIVSLTGITDLDVAGGKPIYHAIEEFVEFVSDLPLVGHNVSFDFRFLNYDCEKHLNRSISNELIDTMRLAKSLINDIQNYKLGTLINYFQIANLGQHSAVNDVRMTFELIRCLSDFSINYRIINDNYIRRAIDDCILFENRKVTIKTKMKHIQTNFLECVLTEMNNRVYYSLYSSCDVLIMNDHTYQRFCNLETFDEIWESWLSTAKKRYIEKSLEVYSEKQICDMLNIQVELKKHHQWGEHVSNKDLEKATNEFDENHPLFNKNCVFSGVLDKYERKEAMQHVINVGGTCQQGIAKNTDYLILGDNSFCRSIKDGKSAKQKKAEQLIEDGSDIQIISESTFSLILKNE